MGAERGIVGDCEWIQVSGYNLIGLCLVLIFGPIIAQTEELSPKTIEDFSSHPHVGKVLFIFFSFLFGLFAISSFGINIFLS
jgi:hypothetical protein